jgi:large subunit ribosomal protein L23
MALFGSKKNTEVKTEAAPAPVARASGVSHVLKNPRITEKATMHSAESVYTFDVSASATKRDIMKAVQALYSVRPRMVRVAKVPTKEVRNARTGKLGVKGGGKKAYVYLKKGETITIG